MNNYHLQAAPLSPPYNSEKSNNATIMPITSPTGVMEHGMIASPQCNHSIAPGSPGSELGFASPSPAVDSELGFASPTPAIAGPELGFASPPAPAGLELGFASPAPPQGLELGFASPTPARGTEMGFASPPPSAGPELGFASPPSAGPELGFATPAPPAGPELGFATPAPPGPPAAPELGFATSPQAAPEQLSPTAPPPSLPPPPPPVSPTPTVSLAPAVSSPPGGSLQEQRVKDQHPCGGSVSSRSYSSSPPASYPMNHAANHANRLLEGAIARGEFTSSSHIHYDKRVKDVVRERGAKNQALQLMNECAGPDTRAIRLLEQTAAASAAAADPVNHAANHANQLLELTLSRGEMTSTSSIHHDKRIKDVARERGAKNDALQLMNEVAGADRRAIRLMEQTSVSPPNKVSSKQLRQDAVRRYEQKKSQKEALYLMQSFEVGIGNRNNNNRAPANNSNPHASLSPNLATRQVQATTTRQAAIKSPEQRRKEEAEADAKLYRDAALRSKMQSMARFRKLENMAESTRKKKPLTPDDVLDPESVSGMKCRLDLDRQKLAKQKALQLLNAGIMF